MKRIFSMIAAGSLIALAAPAPAFAADADAGDAGDAAVTDASTTLDASSGDDASDDASTPDAGDDTADAAAANDAAPAVTVGCDGKVLGDACLVTAGGNQAYCLAPLTDGGALYCGYATGGIVPDAGSGVVCADAGDCALGANNDGASDDGGCNMGGSDPAPFFALLGLLVPFASRRRKARAPKS